MNTDEDQELNVLTERIIGCAIRVSNELGCGFLEKPYENALVHLLLKGGLRAETQHPIQICFDEVVVGDYVADVVVNGRVLVELKAVKDLDDVHSAQCINYLRATGFPICLLLNFGKPRLQIKRFRNRNAY